VYNFLGFRLIAPPFDLPVWLAGLIFVAYLAGTWASTTAGRLSDRLGRRRMLWATALVAVAGIWVTEPAWLPSVIVGLVLLTVGFFGGHSVASSWVGRRASLLPGGSPAQASALYLFAYYLGSSIGGSLGGIAYDHAGWLGVVGYVTGLTATEVSALMSTHAPRREVYDNAYLTIELENGAVGRLWSSFVATGNEHGLAFRIYGTEGAVIWRQESPEVLWHQRFGKSAIKLTRGLPELSGESLIATRFRPGHPEGYALAFANLYRDFGHAYMARSLGEPYEQFMRPLPGIEDGIATIELIEAAERSHDARGSSERKRSTAPKAG